MISLEQQVFKLRRQVRFLITVMVIVPVLILLSGFQLGEYTANYRTDFRWLERSPAPEHFRADSLHVRVLIVGDTIIHDPEFLNKIIERELKN